MAAFMFALLALAVLAAPPAEAGIPVQNFVHSGEVSLEDADAGLQLELRLASNASESRLAAFRKQLLPSFMALPKNAEGHLGVRAARHAIHQLFVRRSGWFFAGLDPSTGEAKEATDGIASRLVGHLEEQLGAGSDTDLGHLAVLAASVEDLVVREAKARLADVYRALQLPTERALARAHVQTAMTTYLLVYLSGGEFWYEGPAELAGAEEKAKAAWPGWDDLKVWLRGLEDEFFDEGSAQGAVPYSRVEPAAVAIGARYARHNDQDCKDVKNTLAHMQNRSHKAGRVRLADFYQKGLHTHFDFVEKVEYLQELGALDNSNASNPLVLIANYVLARPNCMAPSHLYSVCCHNECEDLIAEVERGIAAPSAPPSKVAELVSGISSSTMAAPRVLAPELLGRLEELATVHGGEVNLHGRLFSQWMHHAFPLECPYPGEPGAADPLASSAKERSASEQERLDYVARDACSWEACDVAADFAELPWSVTEELLVPAEVAAAAAGTGLPLPLIAFCLAVSMPLAAAAAVRSFLLGRRARRLGGKGAAPVTAGARLGACLQRLLVAIGLLLLAVALSMLDRIAAVFLGISAIMYLVTPSLDRILKTSEKLPV